MWWDGRNGARKLREPAGADQPTVTMDTKGDGRLDPDGKEQASPQNRHLQGSSVHKGRNLGRFRPLRVPPGGRRRFPIAFGVDTLSCLRR
jgi:hypothetical protein